ncbi:MAG: phosphoglycolate phosphatase [Pseudomonadota bacterium]
MNRLSKLVVFDLDGTLLDSLPDITSALNHALAEHGLAALSHELIRQYIGNGSRVLIDRALQNMGQAGDMTESIYASFARHYEMAMDQRSVLYPRVPEVLDALRDAQWQLACVTNKPSRFTEPLLAAFDLLEKFNVVLSGDSLPQRKPDPQPLRRAAQQCATALERAVIVGDSANDLRAANDAPMASIAVSYGYAQGADLSVYRPLAIVDSMAEIPEIASAYLN